MPRYNSSQSSCWIRLDGAEPSDQRYCRTENCNELNVRGQARTYAMSVSGNPLNTSARESAAQFASMTGLGCLCKLRSGYGFLIVKVASLTRRHVNDSCRAGRSHQSTNRGAGSGGQPQTPIDQTWPRRPFGPKGATALWK